MIKNLLGDDDEPEPQVETTPGKRSRDGVIINLFDSDDSVDGDQDETYKPTESSGLSAPEAFRQSGLAYSAGIAFTAAVIFMLVLGWGADVLLGTSPWGIVGGIILGSVIGFIQLVRITSQIFKK